MIMNKKPYCIITHNDLDGISCAILAMKSFKHIKKVVYCTYDQINKIVEKLIVTREFMEYEKVFITDISISNELTSRIEFLNIDNLLLFDYHQTALHLNQFDWCNVHKTLNNKRTCGTELFYQYLLETKALMPCKAEKRYVDYVCAYDNYLKLSEDFKNGDNLNKYFKILGRENYIDFVLKTNGEIKQSEKHIIDLFDSLIMRYVAEKEQSILLMPYRDKKIGVVFADQHTNYIADVCCRNKPIDYIVIINLSRETMSLRTIYDHIDVGVIAKTYFKGGGHPKAAGAPLNYLFLSEVLKFKNGGLE